MGIIADMLIPGRRSWGLIHTCVIGIAGAALCNGGCPGIEAP
jgi:uncharacterized membrane protein YeaQ/YmgE (transglycosylase-associated protein family)